MSAMCISLNSLANAAPGNLAKITFGLAYYLSHKPYRKLPRLTDTNGARVAAAAGWHGARPLAL